MQYCYESYVMQTEIYYKYWETNISDQYAYSVSAHLHKLFHHNIQLRITQFTWEHVGLMVECKTTHQEVGFEPC